MKCQPQFASSLPSGRYELDMLGATAIATQWRRNFADRRDAMLSKVNWGPLCIAATGASGLRSQSATHMAEYLRPWKLFSLACGTGLLIAGAYHYEAPDWDVPISLLMASLAYLTAPWSMRVMLERQWKKWPAMLFAT